MLETALESKERVLAILAWGGVLLPRAEGFSSFNRSLMMGSARRALRYGSILVCLEDGLYSLIQESRKEKAPFGSKTVGIMDMVVI